MAITDAQAINDAATTYAGFFKTNYATKLVNTIPEHFIFLQMAPFVASKKSGSQYSTSVVTKNEQGFTYASGGAGAFDIEDARQGAIEEATVDGYQVILKSVIAYNALARSVASGASRNKIAYGSAAERLHASMTYSTRKRQEISMIVGQSDDGLGVVESATGADVTITAATWAPGFWLAMENAAIDSWTPDLDTRDNEALVIDSVNLQTRTITFTATPGHTLVAGDVLLFNTARKVDTPDTWNEMLGIKKIAETTSGDSLFNLSTDRSIWCPQQLDNTSNPLRFSTVQQMATASMVKGLTGPAQIIVNIDQWNDLLVEMSALRRYGGRQGGNVKMSNGATAIEFYGQTGAMQIRPTVFMQRGFALCFPKKAFYRVGAHDVTFKIPGMGDKNITIPDDVAGVSLRNYYHQGLFTETPGQITLLENVTVSSPLAA